MIAIANLQCACSLVLNPPASSPYTNLAALVRRHSAEPLKSSRNTQDSFNPPGSVGFAMHSEVRGFTAVRARNPHCFTRRKNSWLPKF
jgi:hypothetical protein